MFIARSLNSHTHTYIRQNSPSSTINLVTQKYSSFGENVLNACFYQCTDFQSNKLVCWCPQSWPMNFMSISLWSHAYKHIWCGSNHCSYYLYWCLNCIISANRNQFRLALGSFWVVFGSCFVFQYDKMFQAYIVHFLPQKWNHPFL